MASEDWTWRFSPKAAEQFEPLEGHVQDRIVSKLDEVVEAQWRTPGDHLEPLTGGRSTSCASGSTGSLAC